MNRSYEEINSKIERGDAVVLTAEEVKQVVREKGVTKAAKEVDVVTTGTFGAMCSSGAFINFGHSEPPIKMTKVWLDDIPAYTGLAAVDAYIGATELREDMSFDHGGAQVIEDLVAGRPVKLHATAYGTDCYPRKDIETYISLKTVNQAYLFNPRNMNQNCAVATNSTHDTLYTYMGKLLPRYGNAIFSGAGQLSPLMNDPKLRTIGIGTRIFLGGGIGYVTWEGTQYRTDVLVKNGVPAAPARSLAVAGDLRGMSADYVRALFLTKYGWSLGLGVGVPIPILDEEIMRSVAVTEDQLFAPVVDYAAPASTRKPIKEVSYAELRSGAIEINGKEVRTSSLSSYRKARDITVELKKWMLGKKFYLARPVEALPSERGRKPLEVRSKEEA